MFIYGQPPGRRGRGGRASSDGEEVARGLRRSAGQADPGGKSPFLIGKPR